MFHAYAARFDLTENLENFLDFEVKALLTGKATHPVWRLFAACLLRPRAWSGSGRQAHGMEPVRKRPSRRSTRSCVRRCSQPFEPDERNGREFGYFGASPERALFPRLEVCRRV